jgi:hypothetical protein
VTSLSVTTGGGETTVAMAAKLLATHLRHVVVARTDVMAVDRETEGRAGMRGATPPNLVRRNAETAASAATAEGSPVMLVTVGKVCRPRDPHATARHPWTTRRSAPSDPILVQSRGETVNARSTTVTDAEETVASLRRVPTTLQHPRLVTAPHRPTNATTRNVSVTLPVNVKTTGAYALDVTSPAAMAGTVRRTSVRVVQTLRLREAATLLPVAVEGLPHRRVSATTVDTAATPNATPAMDVTPAPTLPQRRRPRLPLQARPRALVVANPCALPATPSPVSAAHPAHPVPAPLVNVSATVSAIATAVAASCSAP